MQFISYGSLRNKIAKSQLHKLDKGPFHEHGVRSYLVHRNENCFK